MTIQIVNDILEGKYTFAGEFLTISHFGTHMHFKDTNGLFVTVINFIGFSAAAHSQYMKLKSGKIMMLTPEQYNSIKDKYKK